MMDLHAMTDANTVKMDTALDSIAVIAGGQTWPGGFMETRRKNDPAGRRARKVPQQLQGKEAQNVARAGAKQCGAAYNQDCFVTKKAGMDYLLMGGAAGTLCLTWPEIEAGTAEIHKKGGTSAQVKARFSAAGRGAPRNAKTGQASITAGLDYLFMGGARGTHGLTWRQTEDGAQKLRAKGGASTQIVLRIGAAFFGAPVDAETGQASAQAGPFYLFAGGMKGCVGKTWQEIEHEGAEIDKNSKKLGNTKMVENHHQAALAEHHSHICKSSWCGNRCTPSSEASGQVRLTHTCQCVDPGRSRPRCSGLGNHICRQCHQSSSVCRTKDCSYRACATPNTWCRHLHT